MRQFDAKALFLGPRGENEGQVKELLNRVLERHAAWRRNFHSGDLQLISEKDKGTAAYRSFVDEMSDAIEELTQRLQAGVPFFSPRYIGHMNADLLMPAVVGYLATMLYNPNNVTRESSPVTTELELACGIQLAAMIGYIGNLAAAMEQFESSGHTVLPGVWGHLTSGGTAANIEAIWVARNLKYWPIAVRDVCREHLKIELPVNVQGVRHDIRDLDDWTLLNLPTDEVITLRAQVIARGSGIEHSSQQIDEMLRAASIAGRGVRHFRQGVVLASATAHYSVAKLADLLGFGREQIVHIPIEDGFRMDTNSLRSELISLGERKIPVIAIISVFGSTEEGSVDDHEAIGNIRRELAGRNGDALSFFWHCDAAYGGYALSLFHSSDSQSEPESLLMELGKRLTGRRRDRWNDNKLHDLQKAIDSWIQKLGRSMRALRETDSVTIDPHKWGYIPYPCGAIVFRNQAVRDLTSVHAPYVFHEGKGRETQFIGQFILEGSKPGAAAAACWMAHRLLPLNQQGYGQLIQRTIEGAKELRLRLLDLNPGDYRVGVLCDPDLNIVCFCVNSKTNASLRVMNCINELIYSHFSPTRTYDDSSPVGSQPFFVSKTDLEFQHLRAGQLAASGPLTEMLKTVQVTDSPLPGAHGEDAGGEGSVATVTVIRCTIMGPWLLEVANSKSKTYLDLFIGDLEALLQTEEFRRNVEFSRALVEFEMARVRYQKPVTILFADDMPRDQQPIAELLEYSAGGSLHIKKVINPLAAMTEVGSDPTIQLAVLDVQFPGDESGGVSIVEYIRDRSPFEQDIPCILYTHYSERDREYERLDRQIREIHGGKSRLMTKAVYSKKQVATHILEILTRRMRGDDAI